MAELRDLDPTSPFDIETIRRALGGFSEGPQTAFEASQIAEIAQQRRKQQDQLNFLTRILEAQTTQQIRAKQETDPLARFTEILRTGQAKPTVGKISRTGGKPTEPVSMPGRGETDLSQILDLVTAQHPKTATGGTDRLNAALGQMGEIRKALSPLVTEFHTLKPNDARRKEILREADLLFRNATELSRGIDALAPGFGTFFIIQPLREAFASLGMIQPTPRAGGPAAAPAAAPAPTEKPKPGKPKPPEQKSIAEGTEVIVQQLADLLRFLSAGTETSIP